MFFELNQQSVGPDPPDTGMTNPGNRFEPISRSLQIGCKKSTAQGLHAQGPDRGFTAVAQAVAGCRLDSHRAQGEPRTMRKPMRGRSDQGKDRKGEQGVRHPVE
ncbi:MAG: hypothetical protein EBT04_11035 [Betaproteobacteria bacterium]|nr:hypothetical protein [Betaproteobacteria bacterium]